MTKLVLSLWTKAKSETPVTCDDTDGFLPLKTRTPSGSAQCQGDCHDGAEDCEHTSLMGAGRPQRLLRQSLAPSVRRPLPGEDAAQGGRESAPERRRPLQEVPGQRATSEGALGAARRLSRRPRRGGVLSRPPHLHAPVFIPSVYDGRDFAHTLPGRQYVCRDHQRRPPQGHGQQDGHHECQAQSPKAYHQGPHQPYQGEYQARPMQHRGYQEQRAAYQGQQEAYQRQHQARSTKHSRTRSNSRHTWTTALRVRGPAFPGTDQLLNRRTWMRTDWRARAARPWKTPLPSIPLKDRPPSSGRSPSQSRPPPPSPGHRHPTPPTPGPSTHPQPRPPPLHAAQSPRFSPPIPAHAKDAHLEAAVPECEEQARPAAARQPEPGAAPTARRGTEPPAAQPQAARPAPARGPSPTVERRRLPLASSSSCSAPSCIIHSPQDQPPHLHAPVFIPSVYDGRDFAHTLPGRQYVCRDHQRRPPQGHGQQDGHHECQAQSPKAYHQGPHQPPSRQRPRLPRDGPAAQQTYLDAYGLEGTGGAPLEDPAAQYPAEGGPVTVLTEEDQTSSFLETLQRPPEAFADPTSFDHPVYFLPHHPEGHGPPLPSPALPPRDGRHGLPPLPLDASPSRPLPYSHHTRRRPLTRIAALLRPNTHRPAQATATPRRPVPEILAAHPRPRQRRPPRGGRPRVRRAGAPSSRPTARARRRATARRGTEPPAAQPQARAQPCAWPQPDGRAAAAAPRVQPAAVPLQGGLQAGSLAPPPPPAPPPSAQFARRPRFPDDFLWQRGVGRTPGQEGTDAVEGGPNTTNRTR
ncbi:hypothetical protein C7M84_015738 [Penaeus vannamei]|uniref:Uncharacterized protein n=1 Tax=Penaeus vannamei TaxID=6689 RepID=A0A423U9I5_PENVA|nr:hypothetical protein C7M84_015738 [Penaeus vannamei]